MPRGEAADAGRGQPHRNAYGRRALGIPLQRQCLEAEEEAELRRSSWQDFRDRGAGRRLGRAFGEVEDGVERACEVGRPRLADRQIVAGRPLEASRGQTLELHTGLVLPPDRRPCASARMPMWYTPPEA